MSPSTYPLGKPGRSAFELPVSRRSFLRGAALAAGSLALPGAARLASAYELPAPAVDAIGQSPLVYVSPLRSSGSESQCHGEVWYVTDGHDVLVMTAADRWKAEAIGKGLDSARLWVGDHGMWKSAGGAFKKSPSFVASARFEKDPTSRAKALAAFGKKYPDEWDKWGPRFRNGLADESRVLIRYAPTGP
jgi:hypothetical protein